MGRLMMVDGEALDQGLTAVAEVIREKGEHTRKLRFPEGFVVAIGALTKAEPEGQSDMELYLCGMLPSYTNNTVTTLVPYAIAYNTIMTTVSLPAVQIVNSFTFAGCSELETASLPLIEDTSQGLFYVCKKLKNVDMPRIKNIGVQAFQTCSALSYLDCCKATQIQTRAFNGAAELETLILRSEKLCTLDDVNAFNGTPMARGTGYIYVPADLLEEYRQATNWSAFEDLLRAIEDYPDITGGGAV